MTSLETSVPVKEPVKEKKYYIRIKKFIESDHLVMTLVRAQWNKFRNLEEVSQISVLFITLMCLMIFGIFESLIFRSICLCYPTYSTLQSYKTKNESSYPWLIYWIIYSWTHAIENFFPLYQIPYYLAAKTIFISMCFMPKPTCLQKSTSKYDLSQKLFDIFIPYLYKFDNVEDKKKSKDNKKIE